MADEIKEADALFAVVSCLPERTVANLVRAAPSGRYAEVYIGQRIFWLAIAAAEA
jgi:hypothetical protein